MSRRRLVAVAGVLPFVFVALACSSGGAAARSQYYLSLGDSYAAGYQPARNGKVGGSTDHGFANQTVGLARDRGYQLKLVNLACSGATTASMLNTPGCQPALRARHAPVYRDKTQAGAAVAFLRAHRGDVGLITVSIGGNDIVPCASRSNPVGCVTTAVTTVQRNLASLLRRLRAAAGRSVPIVGTTYPDVILGLWVHPPVNRAFAKLSVTAFKSLINPALAKTYRGAGGRLVDVTAATGAYGSLAKTTRLAPYGRVPVPVAKVCRFTYFCRFADIHPTTPGYRVIAELIANTLPKR